MVTVRVCDSKTDRLLAFNRMNIVCVTGRRDHDVAPLGIDRLVLTDLVPSHAV